MFIGFNYTTNQLFKPYNEQIRSVSESARRLTVGKRLAAAEDAPGEFAAVANLKRNSLITDKFTMGILAADSFLSVQDEALEQAADIIVRMSELASAAIDTTKNTADRIALDAEFQALIEEFDQFQGKSFNSLSLFGTDLSVRVGLEVGEIVLLTQIDIGGITFTTMTISQIASASAALLSLKSRLSSLNLLKAKSGHHVNELQRTADYARKQAALYAEAENFIRDLDLALETGRFTRKQVLLAASQSIITQSNNLVQSALSFFQ